MNKCITKIVNKVIIDDSILKDISREKLFELLQDDIYKKQQDISKVCDEISKFIDKKWIYVKNKGVYFSSYIYGLVPDIENFKLGWSSTYHEFDFSSLNLNFNGYSGRLIEENELYKLLDDMYVFQNRSDIEYFTICSQGMFYALNPKNKLKIKFSNEEVNISYNLPVFSVKHDLKSASKEKIILRCCIENDLIFKDISKDSEKLIENLYKLYKKNIINFNEDNIIFDCEKILDNILNGDEWILEDNESISRDSILNRVRKNGAISIKNIEKTSFYSDLLNCDKVRADIEAYDHKILEDPNRGHWELWEMSDKIDSSLNNEITADLGSGLVARNPIYDIKYDSVVGIDFGTKSTVVAYQETRDNTMPMRIGRGRISKKADKTDYENPTVMNVINFTDFINEYRKTKGRPKTKWNDITVSHTAFESLISSDSKNYYSYMTDLKKWAGTKNKILRIKDKKGFDITLKPFLDMDLDNDFNPIEIYAYYIGLYINNMHNGIYLDYILSFPVNFEKAVRERILKSFEKGIKKSLPESVSDNADVMKNFRVKGGTSEPAAYAICALKEYGFKPSKNEKDFYGVFDFGGGTTDFNFGVFTEASEREKRRFDFNIKHFGSSGDLYLGGENLLEMISYHVFKMNQDILRENNITFTLPFECERFPGSELLINNSEEANLNTKQLIEKLRPVLEKPSNYKDQFKDNMIKLNFFDRAGKEVKGINLKVDLNELDDIMKNRIEMGIKSFFDSLIHSFNLSSSSNINDILSVNIFLAGNASKSILVKQLMDKYSEVYQKKFGLPSEFFVIYPPLGTKESAEILKKNNKDFLKIDSISYPTAKTGVAFGIIETRPGGRIKVTDGNLDKNNEIEFKYYIGSNRRGLFYPQIKRDFEYNKWYNFIDAEFEDFEFYYTTLFSSENNEIDIKDVNRKKCRIDITSDSDDVNVYIRLVSPTVIEYTVAKDEDIKNNTDIFLCDPVKVDLE